jgi:choline transporter-like protein 2/4/5
MPKNFYVDDKTNPKSRVKHGCTDIICTLLFLLFIGALIFVSVVAYKNGKPEELILPHDSEGRTCGKSSGFENKKYLLFHDFTRCISLSSVITGCPTPQVCVEKCPDTYAFDKIPQFSEVIKSYCNEKNQCPTYLLKSKPLFGRCMPELITSLTENAQSVIDVLDPNTNKPIPIQIPIGEELVELTRGKLKEGLKYIQTLLNLQGTFQLAYEDFLKSYKLILCGLGAGALLSFVWIFLMRFFIKPVVYLSLIGSVGILAFATFFCVRQYIDLRKRNDTSSLNDFQLTFEQLYDLDYYNGLKETWLVFSILSGLSLLVLCLILLFLRNRIRIAVQIIKEVSKAVAATPEILFWPIIPLLVLGIIIVYCASVALFLASSGVELFKIVDTNATSLGFVDNSKASFKVGDYCIPEIFNQINQNTTFECLFFRFGYSTQLPIGTSSETIQKYYTKAIEIINQYQWIPQAYVLFMFLWLSAFVMGLNQMTLAGTFGEWYWNMSAFNRLPFVRVLKAFGRAVFFHFGTIAFGSLLIAIVKFIRIILEVTTNQVKSRADKSKIARYLMCCLKCCFVCLERFIKFLNRYAFIITAVYGLNFCRASRKAFSIITNNVVRILVVDKISNFFLFLSNIIIPSVVGVLAFYFFTDRIPIDAISQYSPDLNFYIIPLIFIIVGVFLIAKLFFDIFSMGVDSILMCVLIDLDENDGSSERPYSMSKNLQHILKISNSNKK